MHPISWSGLIILIEILVLCYIQVHLENRVVGRRDLVWAGVFARSFGLSVSFAQVIVSEEDFLLRAFSLNLNNCIRYPRLLITHVNGSKHQLYFIGALVLNILISLSNVVKLPNLSFQSDAWKEKTSGFPNTNQQPQKFGFSSKGWQEKWKIALHELHAPPVGPEQSWSCYFPLFPTGLTANAITYAMWSNHG